MAFTAKPSFAVIKKVTLFINYGEGAILHSEAIDIFKNTINALKTEKGFELVISEQTNTAAQKALALSNLKTMDVVLFVNVGMSSFKSIAEQTLVESFFMEGGKGIGFHASIDHHMYWPWWTNLHNGSGYSGQGQSAFKLIADAEMNRIPALKKMWDDNNLGDPNFSTTELYTLNFYPRGKEGVTVMQTVAAPNNAVPVQDFTWHKKIGAGEYIFSCLGNGPADFSGGWFQKATWAWMEYLNGKYNLSTELKNKIDLESNPIRFSRRKLEVKNSGSYSLKIMNVEGATVLSEAGRGTQSFNLSGFKSGCYFVKLEGLAGSHSLRVLVK
jgi:type 1 glutamine amidotransferase